MTNLNFPDWDTQLFIFLNNLHVDWLDPVMKFFSAIPVWIPMYLLIVFFMFRKQKLWGLAALAVLGISFALTDQLSVHLFKNVFQRLRPCHTEELQGIMRSLEGCGGRYGFISNHAANAFCLAALTARFFKNKYYTIWIFVWAVLVSYSRIYVGKHFPLDVICGAIFGIICQQVGVWLYALCRIIVFKTKGYEMPRLF